MVTDCVDNIYNLKPLANKTRNTCKRSLLFYNTDHLSPEMKRLLTSAALLIKHAVQSFDALLHGNSHHRVTHDLFLIDSAQS